MDQNVSLLETTENTRDLGGYPCRDGMTRSFSLLRSDVPKRPSERDIAFLREYGITTIIDMREAAAVAKARTGLDGVEGFTCCYCPIEEGSGIPASPSAVPASYVAIAESGSAAAVFKAIADAPGGVLFHCTAGKDRTGVIAAVLLWLAGVSNAQIVADYLLTRECIRKRLAAVHEQFPELDMTIVTPQTVYMNTLLQYLCETYDTAEQYLAAKGLTEEQIIRIREKLILKVPGSGKVSVDGDGSPR